MTKYRVVYADPPWSFGSKQLQRYDGARFASLESREYPTLSTAELCSLPITSLVEPDAALFLWVTDAHIPDGLQVMSSWGFRYVTCAFVWQKETSTGKVACTLGSWTIKSVELCLLGMRGRMLQHKKDNTVRQFLTAPRVNHSRKPEEVALRIERLFGDSPKIELFARQNRVGWDCVGDALDKRDIRVSLVERIVRLEDGVR